MIQLTRLNNTELYINSDMIETIEKTPETVISLTNGKKMTVKEPPQEVVARVIRFRQEITRPVIKE
jgi:flagellar protein FlbD